MPFLVLLIYIIVNVIAIYVYRNVDESRNCDVGIVLGAATDDSGVSEVYKQRLNHAIDLYKDDNIKTIIVTGGKAEGNKHSDSFMAKEYLVEEGIPEENILLEEDSKITQQNLENSKKIMDENGYDTALIISDPLHMKRAMLLAKDAGIKAFSSPTKSSAYKSIGKKIQFLARETFFYIGYKWYRIFN